MDLFALLEREREKLLDIGTRNRLISTPRHNKRSKNVEVIHERSADLFDLLVRQKKSMTFLPLGDNEPETEESELSERQLLLDSLAAASGDVEGADHFTDTRLQTDLSPKQLQRRLRDMHNDCRTFVEEQGVNPLFLALGFLRWRESDSSIKDRFAPLILLPVEVDRTTVTAQFKLTYTEDELSTNLSLQQKLKSEFQLNLPELPLIEDLDVEQYFDQVCAAVASKTEWEVLRDDVQLNFFQFAKFLMYRDLDPSNWPSAGQLTEHPVLSRLLTDGFEQPDPIIPNSGRIDDYLPSADMVHVVDADSSQTAAIEEVRQERHLVIQGPPGTGKSQTITNLIATAVRDGKKVLFLSEKMAALEVVKSRLERVGLGAICLELHSQKSRKKEVLGDLDRTLKLRSSSSDVDHSANDSVDRLRESLNRVVDVLHAPVYSSGISPYQLFGRLARLHSQVHFDERVRSAVKLNAAEMWEPSLVDELRQNLTDLAALTEAIGSPDSQPFRGAQCGVLLRSDLEALKSELTECLQTAEDLVRCTTALARASGVATGGKGIRLRDAKQLAELTSAIADSPDVDPNGIQHEVWENSLAAIEEVVKAGARYVKSRERLTGLLNDGALEVEVAEARRHLNAYGKQFFLLRLFNGKYRAAKNTLRELLADEPPDLLEEQLQVLDDIIACQKFTRIARGDGPKISACSDGFGTDWKVKDSDWGHLQSVIDWVKRGTEKKLHRKFRKVRARFQGSRSDLNVLTQQTQKLLDSLPVLMNQICDRIEIDPKALFGIADVSDLVVSDIGGWLKRATENVESIADWIRYRLKRDSLAEGGVKSIVQLIDRGAIPADEAMKWFELAYHEHLLKAAYQQQPLLAEFKGTNFESIRQRFCDAEHRMLKATRDEVSVVHRRQIPGGTIGGMGVLRHELQKKSRHKAIRRLLKEAGPAIQGIKPVFMMSPLSIAQYLEPGSVEFDLLLIDEASQVEPVDALGAIARCRQIVVVGDDKQLPPTKFFAKEVERGEDDDTDLARDLESILGLCVARNVPQRMLSWHYRSQHQSLIQVSNREYYNNGLFVVPSPIRADESYGVQFRYVENGIYERGGSRTNPVEARLVADCIIRHAIEHPSLTLGVGTFSVAQRDAIRDELELLQRDNPQLASFFAEGNDEPFFIKNLENIQGDERDVILISVCYGKDADGYMTQSYGPLNRDGGERRLNVLISRARRKTLVFSSIRADDIDLNRARSRGVVGLKKFLQFAEHGYSDVGEVTDRGFDSEFEREVAKAIASYGHKVESQIGVAGFFIDLAIVDPQQPGRYLLGIECDGASYHSSRSARDRDRLREEVLKNRGWKIHRIWSSDWYQQPKTALKQALMAIEMAASPAPVAPTSDVEEVGESDGLPEDVSDEPDVAEIVDDTAGDDVHEYGIPVVPYEEFTGRTLPTAVLDTADDVLARAILSVVELEGPIHREEIARRVAAMSGSRAGSRIVQAISRIITSIVRNGQMQERDRYFCDLANPPERIVRDRSNVNNSTLRKPENVPPQEIALAAVQLIKANSNAERPELIRAIAAVLGFRQVGSKVRDAIEPVISALTEGGTLVDREGVISLGTEASVADASATG